MQEEQTFQETCQKLRFGVLVLQGKTVLELANLDVEAIFRWFQRNTFTYPCKISYLRTKQTSQSKQTKQ